MNKIYIDYYIKNEDITEEKKNVTAQKDNSTLLFSINNEEFCIKFQGNDVTFEKENSVSIIKFLFSFNKKTDGTYFIKEMNLDIDCKVLTTLLEIKDNKILIKYKLWLSDEFVSENVFKINIKEDKS